MKLSKSLKRFAIVLPVIMLLAITSEIDASANPECPTSLTTLGCIASFDPGNRGGGIGMVAYRTLLNP